MFGEEGRTQNQLETYNLSPELVVGEVNLVERGWLGVEGREKRDRPPPPPMKPCGAKKKKGALGFARVYIEGGK